MNGTDAKRKAAQPPPAHRTTSTDNARPGTRCENLALLLSEALDISYPQDTIHSCGTAPLQIIVTRPDDVLRLAHEKLQTWPYGLLPTCWRRLYEDASLHLVAKRLEALGRFPVPAVRSTKRTKLGDDGEGLAEIVRLLDGAVVIAGAPGRRALIDEILEQLQPIVEDLIGDSTPQSLQICQPEALQTEHAIIRAGQTLTFEEFQVHLETVTMPLIIPDSFEHWPARNLWQDASYLKKRALCGLRVVPVELGSSYTDEGWGQQLMTFGKFVDTYLIPASPEKIGYLAQHDMFAQIPALKNDIAIPDYCWTTPRPPTGAAARTPGLHNTPELDEPSLNAWLGPKGTKTPLHTDPYHNIFCQVVGYKYIRLYAPEESENLYPHDPNEAGIKMDNTSQIDIFPIRPGKKNLSQVHEEANEMHEKFPLFKTARYQEAVLGPGDCLYVPLGWWHYVEALSTSFSVSFWWN